MRTHSLDERRRDLENSPFMAANVVMLKCLRNIYVNDLLNGVDMKGFIDDLNAQAQER